jgi:hypothetical protein
VTIRWFAWITFAQSSACRLSRHSAPRWRQSARNLGKLRTNRRGPNKSSPRLYDYRDETGNLLFQTVRFEFQNSDGSFVLTDTGKRKKTFRQRRPNPDRPEQWLWNLDGVALVPYRLPELIEAAGNETLIVIAEGERKVDLLRGWNIAATCNSGGAKKWRAEHSAYLKDANVVIMPDNDPAGRKHLDAAAASLKEVGAAVRVLNLPGLSLKDDVLDWAAAGGTVDQLYALIDRDAKPWKPSNGADTNEEDGRTGASLDREITRLSKLSTIEYEHERKTAPGKLGVRAAILDKLVKDARPAETGQGRPLELPEPEPWASPVDGGELISQLTDAIRRYVVLNESDTLAVSLWVLHAYCFELFMCTPRLAITSPEKRCGKTTLLDVLACLLPRPLSTANISSAATFRTVEAVRPTLLIDEADTFLGENEELRGILNSGHRSGGQVIRTVGDDFEPRAFSTHCPVAVAQIGKLPSTLADRSINVSMKRRSRDEAVSRFRIGRAPELDEIARKAARWIADNAAAIRKCEPDIPAAIFNRAADNWAPLFAIAEFVGSDASKRLRQAALATCGFEEEMSYNAELLADIREVFTENGSERISSADLVAALVAMTDRPWGECSHGKPLTQNQLARRLKAFELRPRIMRVNGIPAKGYERDDFSDAFSRYSSDSAFHPVTPLQSNDFNNLRENQTVTRKSGVTVSKSINSNDFNDVTGVTDENSQTGDARERADNLGTDGDTWKDGF